MVQKKRTKNNKEVDPFKNLVLDEYEKELEESAEKGDWKSIDNFNQRKKEVEQAARNTLELRKTKSVTFRISQGDLIRLKARANRRSVPYQTLLTALIRDFVEDKYSVKL